MSKEKLNVFIDRVLSDINKRFNRNTITNKNFDLFNSVLSVATHDVSEYLEDTYGISGDALILIVKNWVRKNYGNGNEALPGDTIIIDRMDDPNPITKGTKGVVLNVNTVTAFDEDHLIVQWENGRRLNVLVGTDTYKVIKGEDIERFKNAYSWG